MSKLGIQPSGYVLSIQSLFILPLLPYTTYTSNYQRFVVWVGAAIGIVLGSDV
jgi:hypothetical protein